MVTNMFWFKVGLMIYLFPITIFFFNKVKEKFMPQQQDFIFFMCLIMYIGILFMIGSI